MRKRALVCCPPLLLAVLAPASVLLVAPNSSSSGQRAAAAGRQPNGAKLEGRNPRRLQEPGLDQKGLPTNSSLLYECELSYLQMDMSLIKFSINYLERGQGKSEENFQLGHDKLDSAGQKRAVGDFKLAAIDFNATLEELRSSTQLNASLPFVFFINGFNTFGPDDEINATWMYGVARSFAKRSRGRWPGGWGDSASSLEGSDEEEDADEDAEDQPDGMYLQAASPLARNVVFLTWSIPDLFASNLFSMIPAYYKTVANYDLILSYVSQTIRKLIEFVDEANLATFLRSSEARAKHFRKFHFYGHSLGSHILSDAILQVASGQTRSHFNSSPPPGQISSSRPGPRAGLKFGRLTGLDPATPCFVNLEYGISSGKVAEAVDEVIVLHSNAGFAGVPNERAKLEVVLNGGTFQPGCAWWDFTCHHVRSTDILSYIDDSCQMVAYKCTSYHHFKLGACETCGPVASGSQVSGPRGDGARNCLLVNLPEQHRDSREVLAFVARSNNRTRQLAADGPAWAGAGPSARPIELFRHLEELQRLQQDKRNADSSQLPRLSDKKKKKKKKEEEEEWPMEGQRNTTQSAGDPKNQKKAFYHYVNTGANFRSGRKSHCLQHYQLRLLIYHEHLNLRDKCKPSSFYVKSSDEIKLQLFYETATGAPDSRLGPVRPARLRAARSGLIQARDSLQSTRGPAAPQLMSNRIKLSAIVRDVFHTALVNFDREPKLLVGAQLDNVDLAGLAGCLRRENATSGPNFVLDVAFMSHTSPEIRHAYSSVLCGQLDLATGSSSSSSTHSTSNSSASSTADGDQDRASGERQDWPLPLLLLNLCQQSQLKNVSSQIDVLLGQIKLHRLEETWKVSLLNNLFSLFIEWEPF